MGTSMAQVSGLLRFMGTRVLPMCFFRWPGSRVFVIARSGRDGIRMQHLVSHATLRID